MTNFDNMTIAEIVALHKEGICYFIEDGSCKGFFKEEGELENVQTA